MGRCTGAVCIQLLLRARLPPTRVRQLLISPLYERENGLREMRGLTRVHARAKTQSGAPCKFTATSVDWCGQDFNDAHCWSILELNQWKPHLAIYLLYQQFMKHHSL